MVTDIINFLSGSGRWSVVMLDAYLDESGTHEGSPVLCVAGYMGTRKQWHIFEREWFPKLKKSGLSYFHAKEPKCNKLRPALASAIDKGNFKGIICATKPGTFNQYASSQLKSQMGDAYAICAFMCASGICQWAHSNNLDPISFSYETGRPNADFVERSLKTIQRAEDPDFNISAVAMVKKEECPHLASSDFLSHVYVTKKYNSDNAFWYNYLVASGNILYMELTVDKLIELSRFIRNDIIDRRKWKELKKIINKFNETSKIKITL